VGGLFANMAQKVRTKKEKKKKRDYDHMPSWIHCCGAHTPSLS
jgi:hypothetical protein